MRAIRRCVVPLVLVCCTALLASATLLLRPGAVHGSQQSSGRDLNQIDYAMYFMSEVKDAQECTLQVQEGAVVITDEVTNPAMTCPDMFSWTLFAEVILDGFWSNWAEETHNWPAEPWPMCGADQDPATSRCCAFGTPGNDPQHCPTFPGHLAEADRGVRRLRTSIRSHLFGPRDVASERRALLETMQPAAVAEPQAGLLACGEIPLPDDPESLGRVIRQTNGELTLRNEAFHDFLFRNNLYNADGVIEVFNNNAANVYSNAPYRRANAEDLGDGTRTAMSRIDFPADAIMLKSNWLHHDLMVAIGEKYGWSWDDGEHGYITEEMSQTLEDQAGNKYDCDGTHYLLAFHVSSKDIPNWVWATFEHVSLPGRCDFTGCNDSWGYFSSDPDLPEGAARNYIRPKAKDDDLPMNADSQVFDRGQVYAAEQIRSQLDTMLDALAIGTATGPAGAEPSAADAAWRSYRLKGSQVDFTDSTGRATFLGHSVTEAGFVNGSSCISCHSRAGTDAQGPFHVDTGTDGTPTFPLSVFDNDLSDFGYGRSHHGIPDPNWYHESNQPPNLRVLQTDFVWGFLFARPVVQGGQRP